MKISVIGGGVMGCNHARILRDLNCLHKIVEIDELASQNIENKFGKDILSKNIDFNSDAFIIATPTSTHFEIAKKIVLTQKPILIEKPICSSLEESIKIKNLKKDSQIIAAGHVERHNPIVGYTKDWIKNKKINIINTYRLGFCDRITDAGVVLDIAIHDIDIICHLVECEIKSVYAKTIEPSEEKKEKYCKILITFKNECFSCIEVSWIHPSKIRRIELVGEKCYGVADYLNQSFSEEYEFFLKNTDNLFSQKRIKQNNIVSLAKIEPLKLELEDFIESIISGSNPKVTIDDSIKTMEIIEKIYKSISEKKEIYT